MLFAQAGSKSEPALAGATAASELNKCVLIRIDLLLRIGFKWFV